MVSRDETNLKRLLIKCEEMARNIKCDNDWRFKSYVSALVDLATKIRSDCQKNRKSLSEDFIRHQQRIDFLQGLLNVHRAETPLDKSLAIQFSPKGINCQESHDIFHALTQEVDQKVRDELFTENTTLRQRKSLIGKRTNKIEEDNTQNDLDELLRHHHNMQERVAENMLSLAKNIKEQSIMAGKILKNDSENVEKSLNLANKNIDDLKVHSDKLNESARSSWHCWSWILIILVTVIFINMVLLMRVLKKSKTE